MQTKQRQAKRVHSDTMVKRQMKLRYSSGRERRASGRWEFNKLKPPTASQFAELLTAIKGVESSVDEKLLQLRRELKDERESADERLVKKMRLEKRPTFRKIGNEKQYEFNEEVQDKLDSADAALAQRPPAVEKARSLLQGQKIIFVRQKNIRIADRSENGWATVKELI